jgi:hypothetical protein
VLDVTWRWFRFNFCIVSRVDNLDILSKDPFRIDSFYDLNMGKR